MRASGLGRPGPIAPRRRRRQGRRLLLLVGRPPLHGQDSRGRRARGATPAAALVLPAHVLAPPLAPLPLLRRVLDLDPGPHPALRRDGVALPPCSWRQGARPPRPPPSPPLAVALAPRFCVSPSTLPRCTRCTISRARGSTGTPAYGTQVWYAPYPPRIWRTRLSTFRRSSSRGRRGQAHGAAEGRSLRSMLPIGLQSCASLWLWAPSTEQLRPSLAQPARSWPRDYALVRPRWPSASSPVQQTSTAETSSAALATCTCAVTRARRASASSSVLDG